MLLFYLLWLLLIVYVNYLAAQYASFRALKVQDNPLPDILHDVLPKIHKHSPDYLLLCCLVFILCCNTEISTVNSLRLLISLSLRPIFICLTTFPSCVEEDEKEEDKSLYTKLFLSTHDLMFSGHTCCFLFFGSAIPGTMGFCIRWFFPLSLIAARQHYTIDVVVAMLVFYNCLNI